jgi:hypothetical protein
VPRHRADGWVRGATWAGLAAASLAFISPLRIADLDMWHQMALFRQALAQGRIPREDTFAYTPTRSPVIHHEWGHGAVLYLLCVAAGTGSAGLMTLKYLLSAAIGVGCVACALRRGGHWQVVAWLGVLAIGLGRIGFTTVRAQMFTLLMLAVLFLLLEEDRRGRRWWIALWIPLYVLWVNLHAGFVVGLGLFALYAVEQILRELAGGTTPGELPVGGTHSMSLRAVGGCVRMPHPPPPARRVGHLVVTGLAMVGLMVVNPYGFEYVPYLLRAISLKRPLVGEWRPLWEQTQDPALLVVYALSLVGVIYAIARRGVRPLPGLLVVLVTAYLAARHVRHLSIYAVVWICYLPAYLKGTELQRAIVGIGVRHSRLLFCFWSVTAGLGLGWAISNHFWQLRMPTDPAKESPGVPIYPAGAVAYLAEQEFAGNLMVPFDVGAFVSWRLYPSVKVSFDSRYEAAYPPGALEENVRFYSGEEGWQAVLDRYGTDAVLVPSRSPLREASVGQRAVKKSAWPAGWRLVYRDDGYCLLARHAIATGLPLADRTGEPIPASFP